MSLSFGRFDPDMVIVAAGFDAAQGDKRGESLLQRTRPDGSSGGFEVTSRGFSQMLARVLRCQKPTLLITEGGYSAESMSRSGGILFSCERLM